MGGRLGTIFPSLAFGWLRIKRRHMYQHFFFMGDSGVGKSKLKRQFLLGVEKRGETAVIFDPECEFVKEFYRPERGDVILNPKDKRCPYWNIFDEVTDEADAKSVAHSAFPEPALDNSSTGKFFHIHCENLFAYLLAYGRDPQNKDLPPDTAQLGSWLAHPKEKIDPQIKGTEYEVTLDPKSAGQRGGVLGMVNQIAGPLRMMPTFNEDLDRLPFTIRGWATHRKGWIFITATPETEAALKPLQSMWADMIFLRLLSPQDSQSVRPDANRVTIVLEELGNLQQLTQLPNAITRMRKRGHTIVMGLQNREQLERIYGKHSKTIFSQCRTKFIFATSEEESAKALSGLIGEGEFLRLKETFSEQGGIFKSTKKSWTVERVREPMIMPSQIQGLDDMTCYMLQRGYVVKVNIPNITIDPIAEGLVERMIPPMEKRPEPEVVEAIDRTEKSATIPDGIATRLRRMEEFKKLAAGREVVELESEEAMPRPDQIVVMSSAGPSRVLGSFNTREEADEFMERLVVDVMAAQTVLGTEEYEDYKVKKGVVEKPGGFGVRVGRTGAGGAINIEGTQKDLEKRLIKPRNVDGPQFVGFCGKCLSRIECGIDELFSDNICSNCERSEKGE